MKVCRLKHVSGFAMHRQRGASLLEGVAYLAIAAIVILGAVSLLTGAFSGAQSNRAMEEIISLRTAARKLYAGQTYPATAASGGANMTTTLIAAKAVPGTLTINSTGNGMSNAWGGAVTVAGNGTTFNITYANVPQDACISLLSGANGWTSITRNGENAISAFPATAAAATTTCSTAGDIVFTAN